MVEGLYFKLTNYLAQIFWPFNITTFTLSVSNPYMYFIYAPLIIINLDYKNILYWLLSSDVPSLLKKILGFHFSAFEFNKLYSVKHPYFMQLQSHSIIVFSVHFIIDTSC